MNDFFLNYMILCAEKDVNVGVTLLVNGDLISGQIISYNEYFNLLSKLSEGNSDFKIIIATYDKSVNQLNEVNHDETPNLNHDFIHLNKVSILSKPNYNMGDIPIRIKLSDVSGFHFGTPNFTE